MNFRLSIVALALLLAACGSSPPRFVVQSYDEGSCHPRVDSCVVFAVVENLGGDGAGTATVGLWADPDSAELAKCQAPIPKTATNGVVTVSCTLSNLDGVWPRLAALDEGYLIQVGVVPR